MGSTQAVVGEVIPVVVFVVDDDVNGSACVMSMTKNP